jgi:hypothetical protein
MVLSRFPFAKLDFFSYIMQVSGDKGENHGENHAFEQRSYV